ncbi:hypothetical protein GCM10010193_62000 [Kitasatospora atroaurantiaca]|uniref:DNA/RNA non-specific endonuclease n=1 Tax=Kitasatospora atroaurantiaca TaxID=285545 RepID=A0A561EI74_9ACTN|nr:DNA/RNA non-specific endonuclease [Kitasatospora atroaurantiaca]TWE15316.1 DNA/RNA non-specific endonuclease [Kitasatospora atroaurantiaca]
MTAHPHKPAARFRRTVRRFVLLVLVAVLVPIVGAGARASATTGAMAVLAQSGTVAPLVPFGGIEAASAALAQEVEDFNRQEAEIAQQAKDVVAEAEEITKNAAALRNDTAAFNTKTAAVDQKTGSFNTRAAALSARIDAHNSKPNTFQLPAQAAAANAYEAEASELRAEQAQLQAEKSSLQNEQSQLDAERSKLSSRQSQLTAASKAQDAKAGALRSKEQQLESRGQQLLQQIAQAIQSLADNPPDPAATMNQGGDAAGPPQQTDQSASQGADTADSPSRQPQASALKAYAKQTGSTVDMRPGTAYLTPEAVRQLPAAQAAQLGSPSTTYDGLVRKPNGHYTALQVQAPEATAAPGPEVFKTALSRRGQVVAYKPGVKLIIDEFKPVPAAPNSSDPGPGTPPPPPAGKAACLANKPSPRRDSGGGWIVNTSQNVARRNKIADPTGPSGARAATAEACLTKNLGKGTDARGDITGWRDAQTQAPNGGLARCHLIANLFGGWGGTQDWANLVPCWQLGMNTKDVSMRQYEIMVKKAVDALPEGEAAAVYYVVTPVYRDASSTIPLGVNMSATVQLPNGASWPVFYTTSLLNVPYNNGPNLGN